MESLLNITENPEQNIVIALDASEQAEQAVKWYLYKVHRPGNKVVFVHCIELPEMDLQRARNSHMSPGVLATMWKEQEIKTRALEERMTSLLEERDVPGILRTATGKPGEVICRIAEEENAAMIITGTRGMGKVRRTILGSVSDFLVHHAHCPVVVCRTRSRKQSGSEGSRSRHTSGESFAASIRSRFSSGGKGRSQSVSSDVSDQEGAPEESKEDKANKKKKEKDEKEKEKKRKEELKKEEKKKGEKKKEEKMPLNEVAEA